MNNSQKISVAEKIGYSLGDLAANLVFQTLVTYLAYFYTDIYGLKPEDASVITLIVGLIAGFGFNPLIGALADRTQTKWGKFRPWILFTAVPLGVAAMLAFSTPDFSYKGKIIYAAVTYSILLLLYASNNLPYSALSGVITGDMSERNSISSYRFVAVMFSQFFVQVFMLPIILSIGNGDKAAGIEVVMTWLAIIGSVMLLITFFTTKERVVPNADQKSNLKDDLKDLSKNKPWIIMLTVTALIFITLAMKGGSYVYYFNNYVDETSLKNFISPITSFFDSIGMNFFGENAKSAGFGLFNAGGIIMMIVGITFSKRFADKYGKRDVFMASLFISTLFVLVFILYPPKAVGMMFLSQIAHGFFYGISTPVLWAMIADVADYSEWKNKRRATAIIFSAMMVGLKVGLSIGSSLVALIIGKYGYISTKGNQNVIQPETVAAGAKMLVSIFPAIPFFLACGLLFFYKINKKLEVQIEKELAERRNKN
ncbi:MFS transporter [Chryseobacterium limigenitum]|uniref:Sugar (Glycoside-Pentoside-Hexuronide) transporter n=1 Tax=Chryseobacterium limigenitum TaxID=1612149 RepID=A0A1K2IL28_9FLAO|nr:MFS transporter [Chryseobacterium limigenitum]SFZ92920.1 sugar (Glycoside-Pentoside-Hexuronide) transporter [Chryseobacterium limigenitum]